MVILKLGKFTIHSRKIPHRLGLVVLDIGMGLSSLPFMVEQLWSLSMVFDDRNNTVLV